MIFSNLKKVLSHLPSLIVWLLWCLVVWSISYYFIDTDLILGNLWTGFLVYEILFDIAIVILSWIFFASTTYKILIFSQAKNTSTWGGLIGTFFWVLVSGCPACSITLASYLGLGSLLAILPYGWMELKLIAFCILLWSCYFTLRDLETCRVKKQIIPN
jgi:hypothetical protein